MENMTPYFEVLELRPGATREQICQSYRDLVNVWHPDRFEHNQRLKEKASEKLKRINVAYNKLKDYQPSERRAAPSYRTNSAKAERSKPDVVKGNKLSSAKRYAIGISIFAAFLILLVVGYVGVAQCVKIMANIIIGAIYVVVYFISLFRHKPSAN